MYSLSFSSKRLGRVVKFGNLLNPLEINCFEIVVLPDPDIPEIIQLLFDFSLDKVTPPTKKSYPNQITSSAGGHVEQGENYKNAAERELREELGVKTSIKDLGRSDVITSKERAIHHLFIGKTNNKISTDINEIASYHFLSPKIIKSDIVLHPRKYAKPFHEALAFYLKYIN